MNLIIKFRSIIQMSLYEQDYYYINIEVDMKQIYELSHNKFILKQGLVICDLQIHTTQNGELSIVLYEDDGSYIEVVLDGTLIGYDVGEYDEQHFHYNMGLDGCMCCMKCKRGYSEDYLNCMKCKQKLTR